MLKAGAEPELWAIVMVTAHNLVLEKARVAARLRQWAVEEPLVATIEKSKDDENAAVFIHRVLMSLQSDSDRSLLLLKFRDLPNKQIAQALGLSEPALRQRWSRICRELRAHFGPSAAN